MAEKAARKQVRYERNDINAVLKKTPVFLNREQPVKILNISKQGIAICSNQALKRNNRLKITLSFLKGDSFFLNGQVVHSFNKPSNSEDAEFVELFLEGTATPIALPFKYGIHFEQHYPQFRDYLIESGCKNGFEVQRRGFYQRQTRLK
ncbi:PilZ domain-containing protein [Methylobacter sp.]|uniref:PilZ domain-containing protein n=1 Tax=Methylobacter sp. TaxID=2051955 RepID=UPI002FDEEFEB